MMLLLLAVAVTAQSPRPRPMGYEFTIALPDTGTIIHARAAIHYRRGRSSDDTLRLDLVGMTVDSVREAWFAHDGRVLRVVGEPRSEEHTSELQSQSNLVCRLLLEKKKKKDYPDHLSHAQTHVYHATSDALSLIRR